MGGRGRLSITHFVGAHCADTVRHRGHKLCSLGARRRIKEMTFSGVCRRWWWGGGAEGGGHCRKSKQTRVGGVSVSGSTSFPNSPPMLQVAL